MIGWIAIPLPLASSWKYGHIPREDKPNNSVDSDINATDYESVSVGSSYLLARNLRIHAEFTRDLENERNRGVLGVVSGF